MWESARAPRKTAKLKFGPGKAWMMARPSRKSRGETHPGSTTYERRSGMTTGPPPKMMVPARYMFANRSSSRGGFSRTPRATRMAMKDAKGGGGILVHGV